MRKALVVLIGIWLQGKRVVTDLALVHEFPGLANVPREPKRVAFLPYFPNSGLSQ